MAYDIVQFKSGNKNNIPSQIVPGTVYFAIDGDKGSLYLDFDATHRILMSEHYAAEAGKATYDSTGTQSIVDTYIKGIEFDGTTDTAKVTAILERGSGDTSTTVLLPNAGASSAGIITAGAQTIAGAKTFTGAFTASGGVTFSNASFNYSGFEARSNDVATVVWFSDNTTKGKPVYDNDFTYNPSTNTLTVINVAGTAEYATKATGDSTSIKTTYISNITTDSANHKLTFYKGDGGSTDKELNFVRLSGDTMTGKLTRTSIGGSWISQRDDAVINIDASDSTTSVAYSLARIKFPSKTFTLMAERASNVFGIYGFDNSRTENGYDWGFWLGNDGNFHTNTKLYGAVWNDYAEYRTSNIKEPGRCIKEVGNDTLVLSTERLQPGCEIVSDTFGFAIGETKKAQTPIAASGRVLAYPLEDREEFRNHIGEPVCSGPNGTVSIMTKEEIQEYPHCIIGTISAIPDYETWGTNNVAVNGRIWIRIK